MNSNNTIWRALDVRTAAASLVDWQRVELESVSPETRGTEGDEEALR